MKDSDVRMMRMGSERLSKVSLLFDMKRCFCIFILNTLILGHDPEANWYVIPFQPSAHVTINST